MLRRRATHNGQFDSLADLKASIRSSLRYFHTMRARVKTLLNGRKKRTRHHRLCVSGRLAAQPPGRQPPQQGDRRRDHRANDHEVQEGCAKTVCV